MSDQTVKAQVVVIGAGFTGVAVLRAMVDAGHDPLLIEAANDVGGVWHWNRYPGVRCDIESYEYSFAYPEVDDEWRWSHRLAYGSELQRHIAYTVDRYDLRRHMRFGTRIASAVYDEAAHRWTLTAHDGQTFEAEHVVWATGVLSAAQLPAIEGADRFSRAVAHTADWPADGIEVKGLRVGVIGTGSSGVQIIPELAPEAGELFVFQRTANHVVPAMNEPVDDDAHEAWRTSAPERRAVSRTSVSGMSIGGSDESALAVSDEERRAVYEDRWTLGGFHMVRAFSDLGTDEQAAATADAFVREKIRDVVEDPTVAEKLMPGDHPINTKRMGIGIGYYETFNRPNVRLVDARTEGIERITETGVQLTTGEHVELDVLVYATGFDSFTGAMSRVDIRGRDGLALREAWAPGARTYVGLAISGFPNLFLVNGPGGPSIFANAPVTAEHAGTWLAELIAHLQAEGLSEVEAEEEAQEEWTQHLIDVAEGTLFRLLRNSWYHGANTPGKATVFMGYVGGVDAYHRRLAEVADDGYDGFALRRRG